MVQFMVHGMPSHKFLEAKWTGLVHEVHDGVVRFGS